MPPNVGNPAVVDYPIGPPFDRTVDPPRASAATPVQWWFEALQRTTAQVGGAVAARGPAVVEPDVVDVEVGIEAAVEEVHRECDAKDIREVAKRLQSSTHPGHPATPNLSGMQHCRRRSGSK